MSDGSRDSLSMTTRTRSPWSSNSRRVASMPLPSASCRSMSTMSGIRAATTSIASRTVPAEPSTRNPSAFSRSIRPRRKSGWSSTTTIRIPSMLPLYGRFVPPDRAAPDRHGDLRDVVLDRRVRLGDPHAHPVDRVAAGQVVRDHRGQALEQLVGPAGGELGHPVAHGGVVDGVVQVVALAGRRRPAVEPDVDHERLPALAFEVADAVVGVHAQAADLDQRPAHATASIAAETASASRVAFTAWTRSIHAPRRTAARLTATVATSRPSSGWPVSTPRNDFRDAPTSTGGPIAAIRSRWRRRARLWSMVLPKPIPGSTQIWPGSMPLDRAKAARSVRNAETSATTSS